MGQAPVLLHIFLWSAVLYWGAGFFLLWRIPKIPQSDERPDGGITEAAVKKVSVIIPARNEALNISALLDSLKDQYCKPLEIIVVDDQSTDNTAEIVSRYKEKGVRLLRAGERPEGWTGKNWSCHTGAAAARGGIFLFLDADTSFNSADSLRRIVGEYQVRGGMLSVQPYHMVRRFYEQFSAFFNLVVMIGSGAFSSWSRPGESTGCFGPCILMEREKYYFIGGHSAVHEMVVDDMALCGLCRQAGIPVHCYGGREVISFRMYPGGMRSLIEGWTKNMAIGATLSDWKTIALLIVWFAGICNAALMLSAVCQSSVWLPWGPVVMMVYALYMIQILAQLRRVGRFHPAVVLVFPLLFIFFAGVFFYSAVRVKILRSVTWKGRAIGM